MSESELGRQRRQVASLTAELERKRRYLFVAELVTHRDTITAAIGRYYEQLGGYMSANDLADAILRALQAAMEEKR